MKVMAFFETHLIKLDFTAKAQSTQRTAWLLTKDFLSVSREAGAENYFLSIDFVEDPKLLRVMAWLHGKSLFV